MSKNMFVIEGNLTADPVLRFTPKTQTPTSTYVVAVNDSYYDDEGVKRTITSFIPITVYGKRAENDCRDLKKGSGVIVTGRIRSWYMSDVKKGGFNFEVVSVAYLPKFPRATNNDASDSTTTPTSTATERDEWLEQYDNTPSL